MLSNDTIGRKPTISISRPGAPNQLQMDLTVPSFNFGGPGLSVLKTFMVAEDFCMRTDMVAKIMYGDASKFDWVCKTNGISNPFSLDQGTILYVHDIDDMNGTLVTPPATTQYATSNGGSPSTTTTNTATAAAYYFDPTKMSQKDQTRLNFIQKKAQSMQAGAKSIVPPNVADPGNQEIKRVNGKVFFGSDVIANSSNVKPSAMTRVQANLIKNKVFGT